MDAMGGETGMFGWSWEGTPVSTGCDTRGEGETVLLLPAFSTVSTRAEMAPLAARLGPGFRTVTPDWPGFGSGRHPRLPHGPDLHLAFLESFVRQRLTSPVAVTAAGHAAGYVLALARRAPGVWSRIALIAPTWRGPLPTMMGGYRPLRDRVRAAIQAPIVGHALYRLNVSRPVIATMYRRHVYADRTRLTPEFLARKSQVARRPGGRFGSAAFVTGALDPVRDRESFLALASPPTVPTLVVYGADTPPRSLAEMEALAALPGIQSRRLDAGALGIHEECAAAVAEVIVPFLRGATRTGDGVVS